MDALGQVHDEPRFYLIDPCGHSRGSRRQNLPELRRTSHGQLCLNDASFSCRAKRWGGLSSHLSRCTSETLGQVYIASSLCSRLSEAQESSARFRAGKRLASGLNLDIWAHPSRRGRRALPDGLLAARSMASRSDGNARNSETSSHGPLHAPPRMRARYSATSLVNEARGCTADRHHRPVAERSPRLPPLHHLAPASSRPPRRTSLTLRGRRAPRGVDAAGGVTGAEGSAKGTGGGEVGRAGARRAAVVAGPCAPGVSGGRRDGRGGGRGTDPRHARRGHRAPGQRRARAAGSRSMIPAGVQVFVALEPVDMRFGFEASQVIRLFREDRAQQTASGGPPARRSRSTSLTFPRSHPPRRSAYACSGHDPAPSQCSRLPLSPVSDDERPASLSDGLCLAGRSSRATPPALLHLDADLPSATSRTLGGSAAPRVATRRARAPVPAHALEREPQVVLLELDRRREPR